MLITANQMRAARGMLNWSIGDLGTKVGVGQSTISAIETGRSAGSNEVLTKIFFAFQAAGVELTPDGGVKPARGQISTYQGRIGFQAFFDDVYAVCKNYPDTANVSITNCDDAVCDYWLGDYEPVHVARMSKIVTKKLRVLARFNDLNFTSASYCEYRWLPTEVFDEISIYIYGDKTAFIEFYETDVMVTLVESHTITRAMRKLFDNAWAQARKPALES